ncbi:hypothetical protein K438DRAFT_1801553 [Mycena galopus ATCC 62051]|nr:hypothetical protein K438DRAFT_1801553 [Mycena galopus ATCC 62051]
MHRKSGMSHSNIRLKRAQTAHFSDASQYIALVCGRPLECSKYTAWIRLSTGTLSIELTPPEFFPTALVISGNDFPPSSTSLLTSLPTFEIISSISLVNYHRLCNWHLGRCGQLIVPTNMPIQLGSIRHISSAEYESSLEIALLANLKVIDSGWLTEDPNTQDHWKLITYDEGTSILENGWIRCAFPFPCLPVLVNSIWSCLQLLSPIKNLPPGYLFLCPLAEFETVLPGCLAIPGCTAYWSTNPSGAERLSAEETRTLGLPDINSWVEVRGNTGTRVTTTEFASFTKRKDLILTAKMWPLSSGIHSSKYLVSGMTYSVIVSRDSLTLLYLTVHSARGYHRRGSFPM